MINPSANVFVFGDIIRTGGTDRPGELVNFSISNDLIQIVNCPSRRPALLDIFIPSDACICSTMAFPPFGNSDHVVVSVSIDFPIS